MTAIQDCAEVKVKPAPQHPDRCDIPLYSPGEHLVGFFSASQLEAMKGVELVRNRKGYIKRARQKALTCHIVPFHPTSSLYGTCPRKVNEQLPSGYKIFALRKLKF